MPVESITPTAPRHPGRTVFTQAWRDAAFVHWAVDPAEVAPLMPAGVRPDELDGATHVGLVAFRMCRVGLLGAPGLPYLGSFAETNVRLYSVDAAGRRGVVFLSLDASRLATVLVARLGAGLPYLWSGMRAAPDGDRWVYTTHRRWPGPSGTSSRLVVRVGAALPAPGPLERFVTARWGLHARAGGRTVYWPNAHDEWPLHRAEVLDLDDGLVAAAGIRLPAGPPVSVLWSPGVRVRFGPRLPA